MAKPDLLVLAAGMGSRYGGLKQIDGIGPYGETIMDYSIYDAIAAGFGRVVFVIGENFEKEFREKVAEKYTDLIDVDIVFQKITDIPDSFTYNSQRLKPWGTNHAILMGKEIICSPFAVINADDFYGKESFQVLAEFLQSVENQQNKYCMVGYQLGNTLSESGSVSRGVCQVGSDGYLQNIIERTKIEGKGGTVIYFDEKGKEIEIASEATVSMNMWGFTPDYFDYSLELFKEFLQKEGNNLNSEFYIPAAVNNLITNKIVTCKVLNTPSKWFGVTYADDRQYVVLKINELIKKKIYPEKLFP